MDDSSANQSMTSSQELDMSSNGEGKKDIDLNTLHIIGYKIVYVLMVAFIVFCRTTIFLSGSRGTEA